MIFSVIFGLLILYPSITLTVRRLHDIGKSGWMILVSLIPLVGGIWLIILLCTAVQEGSNKWGEDPRNTEE